MGYGADRNWTPPCCRLRDRFRQRKEEGEILYMLTATAMLTLRRILFPLVTRVSLNTTYERSIVDLDSFVVSFLSVFVFIAPALRAASEPDHCHTMVFEDESGIQMILVDSCDESVRANQAWRDLNFAGLA